MASRPASYGFYDAALTVYTLEAFGLNNVETLNNLGWDYLTKLDYINRARKIRRHKPQSRNPAVGTASTQTFVHSQRTKR
jgi:hypothetical protein